MQHTRDLACVHLPDRSSVAVPRLDRSVRCWSGDAGWPVNTCAERRDLPPKSLLRDTE
jgi:hypothetical protein